MAQAHEDLDERLLHRMLFFTDAVFAIVMTLLVLELRPPEIGHPVEPGSLFAFGLSFAIAAIFWLAHLSTTRGLAHFDWPSAVFNLLFLFPICLIPFVSAWVGRAMMTSDAWGAYSLVMIGCSLANIALVLVQTRGGGRLLRAAITRRERFYRIGRAASAGLGWSVGLAGCLLGQPRVAMVCWVLIPVFIRLCRMFLGPKAAAAPA